MDGRDGSTPPLPTQPTNPLINQPINQPIQHPTEVRALVDQVREECKARGNYVTMRYFRRHKEVRFFN